MTPLRRTLLAAAGTFALAVPAWAQAQAIKIASLYELSGAGATAGTNFKNGVDMAYKHISDHNGIKGYTGVYALKAAIEKTGKVDRVAVARTLKGLSISAAKVPGVIKDVSFDANGDLDRESFIVAVKNGKQEVKDVLPPLGRT